MRNRHVGADPTQETFSESELSNGNVHGAIDIHELILK